MIRALAVINTGHIGIYQLLLGIQNVSRCIYLLNTKSDSKILVSYLLYVSVDRKVIMRHTTSM